MLQKTDTEIFALAKSVKEVETLFTVLELGVDGIIIETEDEEEIQKIKNILQDIFFNITSAKILEIKDIGTGERVCIDTVSMLVEGEGMLVGNKSNFLFLVHNESVGFFIYFSKTISCKRRSCSLLYNYSRWNN